MSVPVGCGVEPDSEVIGEGRPVRVLWIAIDDLFLPAILSGKYVAGENFTARDTFFFDGAPERCAHGAIFSVISALKPDGGEMFFVIAHQSTVCAPRWCGISQ